MVLSIAVVAARTASGVAASKVCNTSNSTSWIGEVPICFIDKSVLSSEMLQ